MLEEKKKNPRKEDTCLDFLSETTYQGGRRQKCVSISQTRFL